MNCTVSSAAMAAWKASLVPGATVPLEWEFAPMSDVIDNPGIKRYMVESINAYIERSGQMPADSRQCDLRWSWDMHQPCNQVHVVHVVHVTIT